MLVTLFSVRNAVIRNDSLYLYKEIEHICQDLDIEVVVVCSIKLEL